MKTIKLTSKELELLNEIVHNHHINEGGYSEFQVGNSRRKLSKSEKGVLSSLVKKDLVYDACSGGDEITCQMWCPFPEAAAVSLYYFTITFGQQTPEFKSQFEVTTDLEYTNGHVDGDEVSEIYESLMLISGDHKLEIGGAPKIKDPIQILSKLNEEGIKFTGWNELAAIAWGQFYANKHNSPFGRYIPIEEVNSAKSMNAKLEVFKKYWPTLENLVITGEYSL